MSELFIAYKGKRLVIGQVQHCAHAAFYPDVDLWQEYRIIDGWLADHPKRQGTIRFVSAWLKKEQRSISERNRETKVGQGPTGVSVRPEIFERIRKRDEARRAGK